MDIENSSFDEDMISKQKDLENKNNENRHDGESTQIVMGMKTNTTTRFSQGQNKSMLICKSIL
jgi:hypothetical protein